MPIHDWTRVSAGTFHDFHVAWIASFLRALNGDILPDDYDAEITAPRPHSDDMTEAEAYAQKRRTLVIRHHVDERIAALIEIVSPGNKSGRRALRSFVGRAVDALRLGYHLLVIDLFPPGTHDPQGIHSAIWRELSDEPFTLPAGDPLTLVAYSAGPVKRAFIEPTAVGKALLDMPLFLDPERHVLVPLEATYHRAYKGVPRKWRTVLEGTSPA